MDEGTETLYAALVLVELSVPVVFGSVVLFKLELFRFELFKFELFKFELFKFELFMLFEGLFMLVLPLGNVLFAGVLFMLLVPG